MKAPTLATILFGSALVATIIIGCNLGVEAPAASDATPSNGFSDAPVSPGGKAPVEDTGVAGDGEETQSFFTAYQIDPPIEDTAGPKFVVSADLNKDGLLDLVSGWNQSQPVQLHLQQRDADGRIAFRTITLAGTTPVAVIAGVELGQLNDDNLDGDINDDDWLDVVVLCKATGYAGFCPPDREISALDGEIAVYFSPGDADALLDGDQWEEMILINPFVRAPLSLGGFGIREALAVSTAGLQLQGIAIDPTANKVYWIDPSANVIQRSNLDGSDIENLVTLGFSAVPWGLALDVDAGFMYWTEATPGSIQRARLEIPFGETADDRTDIETILSDDVDSPRGLVVDSAGNRLFWTDAGTDSIEQAALDGTNPSSVYPRRLLLPAGIAVDVAGGKMYWGDEDAHKIHRANLDGSNVEDLVYTCCIGPRDVALDLTHNKVYWTDVGTQSLKRANLDGSGLEDLVTSNARDPYGLVLDVPNDFMYWVDSAGPAIYRADLDGSNVTAVVTTTEMPTLDDPRGLAMDTAGGKLYWTDVASERIQRANLDGSSAEDVVTACVCSPWDIEIDVAASKIYWTDGESDLIQRSNLDGSNCEEIVSNGLTDPQWLALDTTGGVVYWTSSTAGKVQRQSYTGTGAENLLNQTLDPPLDNPLGIALDSEAGMLYWADNGSASIHRADLDGFNHEEIVSTGLIAPWDVALDATNDKIYWTDPGTAGVYRSDLDGDNLEELPTNGVYIPRGLAIDTAAGEAYWSVEDAFLQRINLTGTTVETIEPRLLQGPVGIAVDYTAATTQVYWVNQGDGSIQGAAVVVDTEGNESLDTPYTVVSTGLVAPWGLALDLIEQKMYWTDAGAGRIQRANLDGSNVEDLVTSGIGEPQGIAVDAVGGKMYWADAQNGRIQRASLDGSHVETLVSGLLLPAGVALDTYVDKLYWADEVMGKIQRANYDGSDVEDLVMAGTYTPRGLAIDVDGRKVYWTDPRVGVVQRANLDGTVVEDHIRYEVSAPSGVAIDPVSRVVYATDAEANTIARANTYAAWIHNQYPGREDDLFQISQERPEWSGFTSLLVANFDGEPGDDIVTGNNPAECLELCQRPPLNAVNLWTNPGPSLEKRADLWGVPPSYPWGYNKNVPITLTYDVPALKDLLALDVDADGDLDIVASYYNAISMNVRWLQNPLVPHTPEEPGGYASVVLGSGSSCHYVASLWNVRPVGQVDSAADVLSAGDIDGDGYEDIAVRSAEGPVVQWFRRPSELVIQPEFPPDDATPDRFNFPWPVFTIVELLDKEPEAIALGDVTGDGQIDLLLAASGLVLWLDGATGTTVYDTWVANPIITELMENPDPLAMTTDLIPAIHVNMLLPVDLDGDGKLDVVGTIDRKEDSGLSDDALIWYQNVRSDDQTTPVPED